MDLAKPVLLPVTDLTPVSLTAHWRNVKAEYGTSENAPRMLYRIHITHEFEAKERVVYPVANFEIKGTTDGNPVSSPANWLDQWGSQTGWFAMNHTALPRALQISVPAEMRIPGLPKEVYEATSGLITPILHLGNNGGKYSFSFTAKVVGGAGDKADLIIFGYGEETIAPTEAPQHIKYISIPMDGKAHDIKLDMEGGTWCHLIAMKLHSPHVIELTKAIRIEQTLEPGDKGYRSAWKGGLKGTHTSIIPQKPDLSKGEYKVEYAFSIGTKEEEGLIAARVLDQEAAKRAGERIALRMGVQETAGNFGDPTKLVVHRSLFSDPYYLDGNMPKEKNFYLGYVGKEDPNYQYALPGAITHPSGIYGGAIKMSTEMADAYAGKKVLGVRLCVAAVGQSKTGWMFGSKDANANTPHIFLAQKLKGLNTGDSQWLRSKVSVLQDGWNEVMFDEPYTIERGNPIYAGVIAQDESNSGLVLATHHDPTISSPNSLFYAHDESNTEPSALSFGTSPEAGRHLLMQFILDETAHNGVQTILQAPCRIYVEQGKVQVSGIHDAVYVYTISGELVDSSAVLPSGKYIVRVGTPLGYQHESILIP
ncbi:MAG: hypothetical protein Q4A64_06220 [Porphyromonadaceae bacterium]|nr:hypothetical protein [Porphyromonadaceae bacterium]